MPRHLPFVVIATIGALLAAGNAVRPFDLKHLDLQQRWLRAWAPLPAERDVAVIGIDEQTVGQFPEPLALWHAHLGALLGALAPVRPAAVGLDLILPERSYDAVVPGSDRRLLKGLLDARSSYPLVLGQTVNPSGAPRTIHPAFVRIAGASGFALFPVDRDGIVRRFDERLGADGQSVATLVGEMARRLGREPGTGYIDYRLGAPFGYIPMHRVLHWAETGDERALAEAFRDKPVLVGMMLPFEDRLAVPVPLAAAEPGAREAAGVLVHAQALRNILNGGFLRSAPVAAVVALCVALALLWYVSGGTVAIALLFSGVALLLAAAAMTLLAQGWHLPTVAPAITAALALGGRHGHDTWLQLRERRRLRASFGGYVSPSVLEEILAGRIRPGLGGVSRQVCVLFSDIRGYTTRSERMTPDAIIRFLNRYFDRTVGLIHERGGAVVCFMGDGIMAVFGEPQPLENPCRSAFEAARAMLRHVEEINAGLRAEGEAPMEIGIGLHYGEAVVGHVGSASRHDYTAIGDVTNVASRLESLTKEAGYRIVLSRVAAEQLGPVEGLVTLGPMAIKGHSPVEVCGYDKT